MNFSKEQIEKAKNCKTIEEFKELAKNEGLNLTEEETKMYFSATRVGEISDDDLDKVAGGAKGGWVEVDTKKYIVTCPFCGVKTLVEVKDYENSNNGYMYKYNPNQCVCGATIRYWNSTRNFSCIKNGEDREAESR